MVGRLPHTGEPLPEWVATAVDESDRVMRARERAARAKARELAVYRHAEDLHEEAAKLQERLGHGDRAQAARSERSTPGKACRRAQGTSRSGRAGNLLGRPVGLQQGERFLMRHCGDAAVQTSAVKFRPGRVLCPASAGIEVQLEPDHPPLSCSQGAPPTGQRVQQFQPAAAGRLQVVRSALRGGARTSVIDLHPQPIGTQLIAHPEPSPGSARGGMAQRVGGPPR
jgi:hypothetical protein